MWKKGTINRNPMVYKRTAQGRLMVAKSRVKPGKWRWDAIQKQPNMVIPDSHFRSGLSATQKGAKEAAEHALRHMIVTNGTGNAPEPDQ